MPINWFLYVFYREGLCKVPATANCGTNNRKNKPKVYRGTSAKTCSTDGHKLVVANLKVEDLNGCISFKWPHIITIEACLLQLIIGIA